MAKSIWATNLFILVSLCNSASLKPTPIKPNIILIFTEDLGIARVRLNGKDLSVIWARPFEVDVTNILQKGQNALEISVVNSWRNRLLGDERLPAEKRLTKTNIQVKKEWQLLDAGLLGPVQILEQQD